MAASTIIQSYEPYIHPTLCTHIVNLSLEEMDKYAEQIVGEWTRWYGFVLFNKHTGTALTSFHPDGSHESIIASIGGHEFAREFFSLFTDCYLHEEPHPQYDCDSCGCDAKRVATFTSLVCKHLVKAMSGVPNNRVEIVDLILDTSQDLYMCNVPSMDELVIAAAVTSIELRYEEKRLFEDVIAQYNDDRLMPRIISSLEPDTSYCYTWDRHLATHTPGGDEHTKRVCHHPSLSHLIGEEREVIVKRANTDLETRRKTDPKAELNLIDQDHTHLSKYLFLKLKLHQVMKMLEVAEPHYTCGNEVQNAIAELKGVIDE